MRTVIVVESLDRGLVAAPVPQESAFSSSVESLREQDPCRKHRTRWRMCSRPTLPNYSLGVHELAEGVFVYLQPDGSWGRSNAGLVASGGEALLVDTLFDCHLTKKMLDELRASDRRAGRIRALVNTNMSPAHTNGNGVVTGAEIIGSSRSVEAARAIAGWRNWPIPLHLRNRTETFLHHCFGAFDLECVAAAPITRPVEGRLTLEVGRTTVEIIDIGPAQTSADVVVFVPSARVVFTGDAVWVGRHPVLLDGAIDGWIDACSMLLGLEADLFVPGYGPVTDRKGVTATRDYLAFVRERVRDFHATGLSEREVACALAAELARGPFSKWRHGERLIATVMSILDNNIGRRHGASPRISQMFAAMADFRDWSVE